MILKTLMPSDSSIEEEFPTKVEEVLLILDCRLLLQHSEEKKNTAKYDNKQSVEGLLFVGLVDVEEEDLQ